MSLQRPSPTASPRWPVLATLVSLVLGGHLVLLAGGIDWPTSTSATGLPPVAAATTATHADPSSTRAPDLFRTASVQVSTVRWIVPASTPVTTTSVPTLPPKAKPVVRTARVAPARAPDLVAAVDSVSDTPPAIEWHADTAPPAADAHDTTALAEAIPTPDTSTEASASLSETATTDATDTAPPSEDTLLAAAANAKPRPTATATQQPPARPPGSMRLQYDVAGNIRGIGYKAQGALDWTVNDGRYDARLEMRVMLLGSRSQTSTGRIGPGGLMPERFADKSRSEKATHFDTEQQRIRFSNNAPEVPLQPGAQDRLSLFMQLAALLQARPQAYVAGQTIEMQVAGTGDAPLWRFDVGEESTLRVPAGEFRVRHIARQPRKEFDSTVEMWLAPDLGHMPVRLRITQANGDFADQKLMQMP